MNPVFTPAAIPTAFLVYNNIDKTFSDTASILKPSWRHCSLTHEKCIYNSWQEKCAAFLETSSMKVGSRVGLRILLVLSEKHSVFKHPQYAIEELSLHRGFILIRVSGYSSQECSAVARQHQIYQWNRVCKVELTFNFALIWRGGWSVHKLRGEW